MYSSICYESAENPADFRIILEFPEKSKRDKQIENEVRSIIVSAMKEQFWKSRG